MLLKPLSVIGELMTDASSSGQSASPGKSRIRVIGREGRLKRVPRRRAGEPAEQNRGVPGGTPLEATVTRERRRRYYREQRQNRRRRLVGLGQRRDTRLVQDVVAGQVRRLLRDVRVTDAAFGGLGVHNLRLRQVDGVGQTVLELTDLALHAAERGDGRGDRRHRRRRAGLRVDGQRVDAERRRVAAPMLPATTPFAPLLLTNTEKPAAAVRPATVASRVISVRTSANSWFSVMREAVDV